MEVCCGNATTFLPPAALSLGLVPFATSAWRQRKAPAFVNARLLLRGIVVDVGMNDATDLTLPALHRGHTVLAFEPGPISQQVLREARRAFALNAQKMRPVQIQPGDALSTKARRVVDEILAQKGPGLALIQAGCSDSEKGVQFFLPESGSSEATKFGTLTDVNMPFGAPGTVSAGQRRAARAKRMGTVPTIRLDAVLRGNESAHPRVALLKVDAQGHELHVLRGAHRLLCDKGAPEFVQLEFAPRMIQQSASLPDDKMAPLSALELLRRSGRFCFALPTSRLVPSGVGSISHEGFVGLHRYSSDTQETSACGRLGCHSELYCIELCRTHGRDAVQAKLSRLFRALGLAPWPAHAFQRLVDDVTLLLQSDGPHLPLPLTDAPNAAADGARLFSGMHVPPLVLLCFGGACTVAMMWLHRRMRSSTNEAAAQHTKRTRRRRERC
jgi:FkbM family methyltransferase